MGAPITGYEVRYRVLGSGQPWTYVSVGKITALSLKGLRRGTQYELEARSLSRGKASAWVATTFTVATTNREGAAALPPVTSGNVSSRWVTGTEIDWACTETTGIISVSAGVLQIGDLQISYNASSADITGTAEEVKTYWLYYDDPQYLGGARTLGASTDPVTSMAAYGRILIDQVTVTFDVAGGTGTSGGGDIGGGGGGSGGSCPCEDAWMVRLLEGGAEHVRAGEIRIGDRVRLTDGRSGRVSAARRARARLVRVVFDDGHTLTCSRTAQLERAAGGYLLATACAGARLACERHGELRDTLVQRVEDAGAGWVIHFSVENSAFLVGDDPGHLLGHHNLKPTPE